MRDVTEKLSSEAQRLRLHISEVSFLETQDCSWVDPVANEMFVLQRMARGTCCYSLDTLSLERITMDDCIPIHTHCMWRDTNTRWKKQAPKNISHMSPVNPGLSVVVSGVSGFQRTCRCLCAALEDEWGDGGNAVEWNMDLWVTSHNLNHINLCSIIRVSVISGCCLSDCW